jgi:hypothetical protein
MDNTQENVVWAMWDHKGYVTWCNVMEMLEED